MTVGKVRRIGLMRKRAYFILGAVAVATALPANADPGKMFLINAVTPGVISFLEKEQHTNNSNNSEQLHSWFKHRFWGKWLRKFNQRLLG